MLTDTYNRLKWTKITYFIRCERENPLIYWWDESEPKHLNISIYIDIYGYNNNKTKKRN